MKSGLLAEFATPENLLAAIHALRNKGFEKLDSHTPWPVKGLDEALNLPQSPVNKATLFGGLTGMTTAYVIQWWTNSVDYSLIVGSRPPHAWPAFIPITFETTVLFAGFSALLSALYLCGLPALWHPVFEVKGFESATIDRFWIAVDCRDRLFDADRLERQLRELGALQVLPFGERNPE